MGIRAILILLAVSGLGVYWGGMHFYTAIGERSPLEITCGEYLKHRPDNRYLRLTECEADLDHMAIEEDGGVGNKKVQSVYIPLRAKGVTTGATQIVLKRDDAEMTTLVGQLDKLGDSPADEAKAKAILDQFEAPNEGLVQFGLDLSDKDMRELKNLNLGLADEFMIMERGKSPKLLLGGLALLAGCAGFAFMGRGIYRRFRPAAA